MITGTLAKRFWSACRVCRNAGLCHQTQVAAIDIWTALPRILYRKNRTDHVCQINSTIRISPCCNESICQISQFLQGKSVVTSIFSVLDIFVSGVGCISL